MPCIIGGESEALGFHQETTEESRNKTRSVLYKTLHYEITFEILLYGSTTVIRTKTLFSTQVKLPISVAKFKIQNTIFLTR